MKKAAVILSGCGVFDGSEVYETVSTLLALDLADVEYDCFAPNIDQKKVINHLNGKEMIESRNVLIESARITRGDIEDISKAKPESYDFAIYPGGYGAALNLSDFALSGEAMQIESNVLSFAKTMKDAKKPQGFICIAPAMITAIYGSGIKHTIGDDKETADLIKKMGGQHENCGVKSVIIDKEHKVVSTPAYMLANRISEAYTGITALIKATLNLT